MNHDEYNLQCYLVERLRIVEAQNNGEIVFFSVPNQEVRGGDDITRIKAYSRLKKSGNLVGVSDLIVVLRNNVFFVEMKTDKGRQSENQRAFQDKVERLGYQYFLLRNQDNCDSFVDSIVRLLKISEKKD